MPNDDQSSTRTGEQIWTQGYFELEHGSKISNWILQKELGSGANGCVWKVHHAVRHDQMAVIKMAKTEEANATLKWEAEMLIKLYNANKCNNIVMPIEDGETVVAGNQIAFLVIEMTESTVDDLLQALYDLHSVGLLHRDIKPENMGLLKGQKYKGNETRILKLFDLGMARIFTDGRGRLRIPRTWCGMRGTYEWSSARAELGRDQSRVDDLFGWFYTTIEWINPNTTLPILWSDRGKSQRRWLKKNTAPACFLLRNCPLEFYKINAYLHMLSPSTCPDYEMLCHMLVASYKQLKRGDQVPFPWPLDAATVNLKGDQNVDAKLKKPDAATKKRGLFGFLKKNKKSDDDFVPLSDPHEESETKN